MKVVTSGSAYIDIDAWAGIIAYAELLKLNGEEAIAASTAPLNGSVTPSLQKLQVSLSEYKSSNDEFVIIDTSSEKFFDPIVGAGTVVEVIDHHPGHEAYWQEKIGDKAQIEPVGAACTQIFERWEKAGCLDEMTADVATILAAGILDNTLNFNAGITNQRDHHAYETLTRIGRLPKDFAAQYFSECQAGIEKNLGEAVKNDVKEDVKGLPYYFGQLVAWDVGGILLKDKPLIDEIMDGLGEDWAVNLISISEGKSYILSKNPQPQKLFSDLFGLAFTDGIATPMPMMLRKEIHRAVLDKKG
jgi:inorganic pyrophosphatase/exopolyphosphatase